MQRFLSIMEFGRRLAALRKETGLTQHAFADLAEINVSMIRRYEGGTSQPSLEVLKKLAIALSVSADALLFEDAERGPDDELRLQFEAVGSMSDDDRKAVALLLDAFIKKNRIETLLAS